MKEPAAPYAHRIGPVWKPTRRTSDPTPPVVNTTEQDPTSSRRQTCSLVKEPSLHKRCSEPIILSAPAGSSRGLFELSRCRHDSRWNRFSQATVHGRLSGGQFGTSRGRKPPTPPCRSFAGCRLISACAQSPNGWYNARMNWVHPVTNLQVPRR